jgi:hypothetical protein
MRDSPSVFCAKLVTLGDASPAVYLDVLYGRDPDFRDTTSSLQDATNGEVALAALTVHDHVPFEDLLERYQSEYFRSDLHHEVKKILTYCTERAATRDPVATVGLIIDTARAVPSHDEYWVISDLGRAVHYETLEKCMASDVLGRVTPRIHAALVAQANAFNPEPCPFDRTNYLTGRVHAHAASDLSPNATQVALTLAGEWLGTLQELLETSQQLDANVLSTR